MFPFGEHREEDGSVQPKTEVVQQRGPPSAGRRRSILKSEHLDSSPRMLRQTLEALAGLLEDSESRVRRRALLMFGDLVAGWQRRFSGDPISVEVELLPDAVRISFQNSQRTLTRAEWDELASATVTDLVDAWGIDRRHTGSAWFEFRYERPPSRG